MSSHPLSMLCFGAAVFEIIHIHCKEQLKLWIVQDYGHAAGTQGGIRAL